MSFWMNGWNKRAPITISNPTATANYQHLLSLTYDADMNADFSDIRFTDAAGNYLPYWIEDKTNSTSATVWIKVIAPNTTTIYMYYGNTLAPSASNGYSTFDAFDDFLGSAVDTTLWDKINDPTYITVTGGICTLTGTANVPVLKHKTLFPTNYSMRWKSSVSSTSANAQAGWYGDPDTTKYAVIFGSGNAGYKSVHFKDGSVDVGYDYAENTSYHVYEMARDGSSSVKFYKDGSLIRTETTRIIVGNARATFVEATASTTETVDWCVVRKYQATEPSLSVSTEETISLLSNKQIRRPGNCYHQNRRG